jgi:competence protein ComEC
VVTPGRKKILIDGGQNDRALRFLSWKYRLEEVEENQPIPIDLIVLTHADADHINGLIPVITNPKLRIKRIIHNGLATHRKGVFEEKLGDIALHDGLEYIKTNHDTLDELSDTGLIKKFKDWKDVIVEKGNIEYHSVDSGIGRIDLGDPAINLEVVGPHITRVPANSNNKLYQWFGDHAHTINGHSVVLRLIYNNIKILLAGDLNIEGSKNLLSNQELVDRLDAHILKAPHHGSHEFYLPMLEAVNPQISIISSGDDVDHGHPRANFLGSIGSVSRDEPLVFQQRLQVILLK